MIYTYKQPNYGGAYVKSELGEQETLYNLCYSIDGTKDSAKMLVNSFVGTTIKPFTILYDDLTNDYWIVKQDNVERHKNESGFFYKHTLKLNGIKELLNHRDLTDCGFNSTRYSIYSFIKRLFKLSSYDITSPTSDLVIYDGGLIDTNTKVEFIKTFENYTLLSALREFLDAFNCYFSLTFTTTTSFGITRLSKTVLYIYPKTGRSDLSVINANEEFLGIQERRELDINSYGACVVSNANNVVSSNPVLFPSVGTSRLISDSFELFIPDFILDPNNTEGQESAKKLFIKLPAPAFKVHYIDVIDSAPRGFDLTFGGVYVATVFIDASNFEKTKQAILTACRNHVADSDVLDDIESKIDQITQNCVNRFTWRLYDGLRYDYTNNSFSLPPNAPDDFKIVRANNENDTAGVNGQPYVCLLTDKDTKNHLEDERNAICWERGSDKIYGWERFAPIHAADLKHLDINDSLYGSDIVYQYDIDNYIEMEQLNYIIGYGNLELMYIRAKVYYTPMTDLKIKIDNSQDNHNVQVYNQNGKLSDGVGLSKVLNSYSKEIMDENITKYMTYYDIASVPKVGQIVNIDDEFFIINNISLEITKDEGGIFIDGEFTMSKQIAVKSLMISPNTNIRDYAIPQKYNVKRKQLYRDYYDFTFVQDNYDNEDYLPFDKLNMFESEYQTENNYMCAIMVKYKENNVNKTYYYRLSTTRYNLEKMFIITCDFGDNNIIGYDCQNVWTGFDIQHIINNTKIISVPVQYTNDIGEVEGITLQFVSGVGASEAFDDISSTYDNIYSNIVYIDSTIYQELAYYADFSIMEGTYNKDATEVPFFEYVVQVNDSDNVLIGNNILTQREGCVYLYCYATANAGTLSINNADSLETEFDYDSVGLTIKATSGCKITNNEDESMSIGFYTSYTIMSLVDKEPLYNGSLRRLVSQDIAIFRYAFDPLKGELVARDLIMIIKNPSSDNYTGGLTVPKLHLYINHYSLK